jgi:transposase
MELTTIYKRVIGLDVHQAKISACALIQQPDGTTIVEQREFGAFKRDRRALAQWASSLAPEVVVMESTGIYWKSPYAALDAQGIAAWVVNARHVKNVPGRKTDVGDAHWLATLARAGLLRGSFIPQADIRHLRLIARQRQKLGGMLASEKNRLHKVLADSGIRLNVLVSDIHGQSARAMVKALIAGKPMDQILDLALRLHAGREKLFEALQPDELSASHLFVLTEIMQHIEDVGGTHRTLRAGFDPGARCLGTPTRAVADDSRHRLHGRGDAAGGDQCGNAKLRLCRATGLLGGDMPWQQRECGKAQERQDAQGQRMGAPVAVRVRPGRQPKSLRFEGQSLPR